MSETPEFSKAMDQLEIAITRTAHQFAERIIEKGCREEVLLDQLKNLAAVQNALTQMDGMGLESQLQKVFEFVQAAAAMCAEAHMIRAKANVLARHKTGTPPA